MTNPQDSEKPDGYVLFTPSGAYVPKSLADNELDCFSASVALSNLGTSERMLAVGWRIRPVKLVFLDEDK